MRVAIVGPFPLDIARPTGGIEAVILNLIKGLRHHAGIELHVITCNFEKIEGPVFLQKDFCVHMLTSSKTWGRITGYARERRWIQKKLKAIQPDIVHVHGTDMYAYAVRNTEFCQVITVHGILRKEKIIFEGAAFHSMILRRIRESIHVYFERCVLKQAHNIIIISPYVKKTIGDKISAKMFQIYNPVDDKFFQIRNEEVANRILFVGMIRPRKGLLDLLRAIHIISKKIPTMVLHIVGKTFDPEYFNVLQDYVYANNLSKNVRFLGQVDEKVLLEEFSKTAILVLPSVEESAPMVIAQAMAAEKPVIATRVGGIPYLVDEDITGFLVEYGDIRALSKKMVILLSNRALRLRMGKKGKEDKEDKS